MKFEFDIPIYNNNEGLDIFVEDKAEMTVKCNGDCVEILANSEALVSLGKQFLYLAKNKLPNGSHIHYDGFFMKLKSNSKELIISKID